jgi:glycosyltransferase involved in cell wall biosynthesis
VLPDEVAVVGVAHADDIEHYEHVYRLGRYWNKIICVSDAVKEGVLRHNATLQDRVVTIRNGVPLPPQKEFEAALSGRAAVGPIRLMYAGRFIRFQKRIQDYPLLAENLVQSNVNFRLTMCGEGDQEAFLNARMGGLMHSGQVSIPGRVPPAEMPEIMRNNDIMLLLSDFEGMPISLLEAMGWGCVPIVYEIESGVAEIIQDGKNGLVVPKGNIRAAVAAIARLANDREELVRMSRAARQTLIDFQLTDQALVKQYAAAFSEAMNEIQAGKFRRPRSLNRDGRHGGILPPPRLQSPMM